MRSFFYKEIIPPDMERRNYLLKKLAYLKKRVKPAKGTQNLIKMLRRELKTTEGKTLYYRCNKGLKMQIGDENSVKKSFLMSKDPRFLESVVNKLRSQSRKPYKCVHKERYMESIDSVVKYQTIGGVMTKPDYFKGELHRINRKKVSIAKYPHKTDQNPYIGIELEYASNLNMDQIAEKIIEHKLQNEVRVMRDGSIRVNEIYPNQVEFCVLTRWSDLKATLNKLKPIIFDKPQNFHPNTSCGLHVHLDMRNDNPRRVFSNLVSMQSVLFDLAAEHRRGNKYCVPIGIMEFENVDHEADDAHYHAISKYSYYKHQTIEVRIHQSTLDLTRIEKWITLLKRIADYKGDGMELGTFASEFKILKEKVAIEPELIKYIEERDTV